MTTESKVPDAAGGEELSGQVALVTGGTGALGRHVILALHDRGASVHATWVDESEVDSLKRFLGPAGDRVHLHRTDVTDPDQVEDLLARIGDEAAPPSILCNLVGGFSMAPVEETSVSDWRNLLEVNATSAFVCSRAALPLMRTAGWGRIVNVSAFPALERGQGRLAAYSASKAAVLNLTHSLSREAVENGVTVNALVPKIIDTPANREAMPDADPSTWIPPREIADVLAFVVSDRARTLTGAALTLTLD